MKKINVFTTLYKRPLITEICFLGLDRIRNEFSDLFDFRIYAIGEEDSFTDLCRKHDIIFIRNSPDEKLGEKIQGVVRYSMQERPDFDYLMKIDTDDLITKNMLLKWVNLIDKEVPAFGSRDKYVIDVITGESKYFEGYPNTQMSVSGGKMIRADVVKALNGKICKPFLEKGIDYSIKLQLQKQEIQEELVNTYGNIELKSPINIHGFDDLEGEQMSTPAVTDLISPIERSLIRNFTIYETYRRNNDCPEGIAHALFSM